MIITSAVSTTKPAGLVRWFSGLPAHAYALSSWLVSLVLFRLPLSNLAILSFRDENSSHILLIPLISGFLIVLNRKRIFRSANPCPSIGASLLLAALVLWYGIGAKLTHLDQTDQLSVAASLILLVWIGVFVLCYGPAACRAAAFPLLFLLLMIPIPVDLRNGTVVVLQRGSAATCYALFRLLGVPVIRHGFQFSLPGIDIEVAKECSGIHSALALLITGLLLQYAFLASISKKVFFVLCIFPIAIFKNAVRIVTISWLGIHVDPAFFYGQLHHHAGLPFGVLAVALLAVVLWLLRRPTILFGTQNESLPLGSRLA